MTVTDRQSSASAIGVFLFTDLEGSTRLWQAFPQAMRTALARHDALLREVVEGCNGSVVKATGDGFHVVFGSVRDALCACIAAQQRLAAESWGEVGPLRVRMGMHVGEAEERGGDYYGPAVNRAARVMAAAHGGQVLMSEAVAGMAAGDLPDGATLRDLGEHRLKDLQRPEHIFQLVYAGLPADYPPIVSLNHIPNNLPSQPTVFVGRQAELEEIRRLLMDGVHLLTLVGPGGTGKTRLALQSGAELSDRFVHGTFFVDLAVIRDPGAVLAAISRTIGLDETSERPLIEELKRQLRDKEMLLLLDNFEQVTAAAVGVAELMQYCPRLKMLATSREALHLRGERLYPVQPLGLPDVNGKHPGIDELAHYEAVQLFVERAQAVRPSFELNEENARAVAELCVRLDGLPLAIELAAARTRIFSPQALQQRLGSRLSLLQGGARDLPERQQTLRDTIGWSYELLEPHEQRLFALVSVFSSCTFEAAAAVAESIEGFAGPGLDVLEELVSLADKSLLRLADERSNGSNGGGEPRLRMLETIREYATERLREEPELHAAACREHAAYFADFAGQQWRRMAGAEREAATAAMAADVENLKIAWRYWVDRGELAQLQKMVDGLWLLYDRRGWYQAIMELTTDLLNVLSGGPSSPEQAQQEIMLQTSLARALLAVKGYTPEVEEAYRRALALSEGQGEIPQLFPVLRGLASYYLYRGEYDKGAQMGRKILALAEREDDDDLRVHGYLVLGANMGFLSSFRAGLAQLDQGITLFEREQQSARPFQLGAYPGIVCYTSSAFFLWWLGYADRALERAERAMTLARSLNHPFTMAYTLHHTAVFLLWRGDSEGAQKRARAMCEVAEAHGFQIWNSLAEILQGAVQTARGETEAGLARIEQGFREYQGLKSPPVFFPELVNIRALAYAQAGKGGAALELIDAFVKDAGDEMVLLQAPEMALLKGELLLAKSSENRAEAAALWRWVLDASLQMEGKLMALRAAMRLCRLEASEGNIGEGCRLLREIYGSFTEGFETVALREARGMLEELGDWR